MSKVTDRYNALGRLDQARLDLINSMQRPKVCSRCRAIYEQPAHPKWNCPGCGKEEVLEKE